MWNYNYYVYILTNPDKSVVYIGVTNNLNIRLAQHFENRGNKSTFAGKYYCYLLVYYEHFSAVEHAIAREKEIKKWRREKKDQLIASRNPDWVALNKEVSG